jgi:hypothetical protein
VDDVEEDTFEQKAQARADGDCKPESSDEVSEVAPLSLFEALEGLVTPRLYMRNNRKMRALTLFEPLTASNS